MFGLGFWEIGMILAVALVVLGPSKLPELAKGLGKSLREFRKATEDFKSTVDGELYRPEAAKPIAAKLSQPVITPSAESQPFTDKAKPIVSASDPIETAEVLPDDTKQS